MKILIEALHGLGDTVCMLPMISLVRKTYPSAYIVVLLKFPAAGDIIKNSDIKIDQILYLDIYKNIGHSLSLLRRLHLMHFDYGISSAVTSVKKARIFMGLIHPRRHIGLQTMGKFFDSLDDTYHFVEANLLAVKEICTIPNDKQYPVMNPDRQVVSDLRNKIGLPVSALKVVGVCIGDADPSLKNKYIRRGKVYTRSWGIENMSRLISMLQRDDIAIILLGGSREIQLLDYLRNHVKMDNHIINMVGKTSLKESIALVSLCDVVFGVDTGMQHIAAAVGAKTVSVFGPTNPATHGSYSEKAHFCLNRNVCSLQFCYGTKYYINCPYSRVCISSVSVDEAYDQIMKNLNN